jgi:hypothetical protein
VPLIRSRKPRQQLSIGKQAPHDIISTNNQTYYYRRRISDLKGATVRANGDHAGLAVVGWLLWCYYD